MARAADLDSADSQFYVCMGTFPHLDGKYTAFGQVVDFGEKVGGKDALERLAVWDELIDVKIE
jgi:cyclophilin family peptidyl-prolyl cis-trans isomerase